MTVARIILDLAYAARLIAPDIDWVGLQRLGARLASRARPQNRLSRLIPGRRTLGFGERAVREGWTVVEEYADRGLSGSSLLRPGVQALMRDAQRHVFDLVLAESLDRLSRYQEDVAALYKRLRFAGAARHTL
jgi:hypothetical protein